MGVWMIGTGNISVKPQVDEALIKEYIQFSKRCFPKEYGEEYFLNTWFFDEDNKLFSLEGKFAEPSIWYRHIKENCEKSEEKYRQWKRRVEHYGVRY